MRHEIAQYQGNPFPDCPGILKSIKKGVDERGERRYISICSNGGGEASGYSERFLKEILKEVVDKRNAT